MAKKQNRRYVEVVIDALETARRILKSERKSQFESFTIPPDRSFDHMNKSEAAAIRRFDRAIAKIDAALNL